MKQPRRKPHPSPVERVMLTLLLPVVVVACTAGGGDGARPDLDERVVAADIEDRSHVEGPVDYDRVPPLGGPHAPVWANCGVYEDQIVPPELAVHSMEHGAVWIAYPDDGQVDVDRLRDLATGQPDVLVSPSDEVDGVVATAWGVQLIADGADDPGLPAFIEAYVRGPGTPEPGAPCSGGAGEPS